LLRFLRLLLPLRLRLGLLQQLLQQPRLSEVLLLLPALLELPQHYLRPE
jgi:hypothetical protein